MTTGVPSENLECWNGTTYGYNTSPATRRKRACRAFGNEELDKAIAGSQEYLLSIFNADKGLWVAELEANTTLTSNISISCTSWAPWMSCARGKSFTT